MTVGELIDALLQVPTTRRVVTMDPEYGEDMEIVAVKERKASGRGAGDDLVVDLRWHE